MVLDGFPIFKFLHHGSACSAQQQGDDVTDHLKDLLYRLVHTLFHVLNGELLRLFRWLKPPLFYPTKLQKIIEKTKHFLDYFIMKKLSVTQKCLTLLCHKSICFFQGRIENQALRFLQIQSL